MERHRRALAVNPDAEASTLKRSSVSLEIPDELLNKAFKTLTNVSKVASNYIMVSSRTLMKFTKH